MTGDARTRRVADVLDVEATRRGLVGWANSVIGEKAEIANVRPMPGNAGLSFGFDVVLPGSEPQRLVIRLSPPGVRRQGNTDVLRQVPLLRGLGDEGFPVPPIIEAIEDETWFGTQAFIMAMLPGHPLHMFDRALSCDVGADGASGLLAAAVDALCGLHSVREPQRLLDDTTTTSLEDDLDWALLVFERAHHPAAAAAVEVAARLRAHAPADPSVGLRHGDFQTNNILFDGARLTGVVDWELAGIGPQLLDLGWLCMWTDPSCWEPSFASRLLVTEPSGALVSRYEANGRKADDTHWFVGLACLRFAAIAAYNLRLHREGKRVDAFYEQLAPSIPYLLDRAVTG
jgi:aminoglycoside phosphotransferase (APT) family kinase protein